MGLLPDTQHCGLRMRRECRGRFPCHCGLALPICITARARRTCRDACQDRWQVVSFEVVGGDNVPGACATRNLMYLVRGPWMRRGHRWVSDDPAGPPVHCLTTLDLSCWHVGDPTPSVAIETTDKGKAKRRWRKIWYDFSQCTTLHGVRNVTDDTPFPIRRYEIRLILSDFTEKTFTALEESNASISEITCREVTSF